MIRTDQYIVVGSSRQLYLIDPGSLSVEQSFPLSSANRLLVANVGGSYDGNVLSCDNDRCFLAEIADLQDVNWSLQPSHPLIRSGVENIAAVLSPSAGGGHQSSCILHLTACVQVKCMIVDHLTHIASSQ